MHGKYRTAENILSIIELVGWLGVAGGALIIFRLIGANAIGALTLGGAAIAVSLLFIAMTQLARAQIDTAQTNAEILAVLKKQASKP